MSTSNKPAIDPEAFARLTASLKQAGAAMVEAIKPIGDALTAVYGPRAAVTLERQAMQTNDSRERARLRRQAAQTRSAATLAWRRIERRKKEADRDRAQVSDK